MITFWFFVRKRKQIYNFVRSNQPDVTMENSDYVYQGHANTAGELKDTFVNRTRLGHATGKVGRPKKTKIKSFEQDLYESTHVEIDGKLYELGCGDLKYPEYCFPQDGIPPETNQFLVCQKCQKTAWHWRCLHRYDYDVMEINALITSPKNFTCPVCT